MNCEDSKIPGAGWRESWRALEKEYAEDPWNLTKFAGGWPVGLGEVGDEEFLVCLKPNGAGAARRPIFNSIILLKSHHPQSRCPGHYKQHIMQ